MSNSESTHASNSLAAFGVGLLVGAGMAMLYAPRSGRETRELLHRKKDELTERADHALHDVREQIAEKGSEIAAAMDAGREAMREKRAAFSASSDRDEREASS